MNDSELLHYMADDAAKWAAEFCKIARNNGHCLDEGWMIGWFANAIEHASSLRVRKAKECFADFIETYDNGQFTDKDTWAEGFAFAKRMLAQNIRDLNT